MTADEAWKLLEIKFSAKYKTVQRAFITMDMDGDSFISLREFRQCLEFMGIYMTGTEFRKLWRQFDMSGDGKINYAEFNNKVGYMILPMAANLEMKRPDTPKMRDWQIKAMARTIQKKIKDIEGAFKEIDMDGSGRISHAEFIQALRKIGLTKIGNDESYQMMHKYKSPDNNSGEMLFPEFKACIEDYLKLPTEADTGGPKEKATAALEIAEKAVQTKLPKNVEAIKAFFKKYDEFSNNEVSYDGFKRGLADAGIVLSKAQFDSLCYKLDALDDGIISYTDFALIVVGGNAKVEAANFPGGFPGWERHGIRPMLDIVTGKPYPIDVACTHASAKLGLSIAEGRLVFALLGRRADLKAECARLDPEGAGSMSKDKFAYMLDNFGAPSGDDILSTVMQKFDRLRSGRLNYVDLERWLGPLIEPTDSNLRRFNLEKNAANIVLGSAAVSSAAASSSSASASKAGGAQKKLGGTSRDDSDKSVATDALDMSAAYHKMQRVLGKKWVQVVEEMKRRAVHESAAGRQQPSKASLVPASVLRDSFADHGVALTSKEVRGLSLHYCGAGPRATRQADGAVDLELLQQVFLGKGKGVAAGSSGTARRSTSVPPGGGRR